MASSSDGFRFVFFQGHPEYDDISLAKEHKREVARFLAGEREYPEYPAHYFAAPAIDVLERHRRNVEQAVKRGSHLPPYPEDNVLRRWEPTWSTQGQTIYANWLAELARRVGS